MATRSCSFLKLPVVFALALATTLTWCQSAPSPITQEELVRRTQVMMNAVAPGDKTPWQQNLADDLIYFDEKGKLHDKTSLVKDVEPMPAGYSGSITVVRPKSHIEGNVAVLSYDMEETESIYGQNLVARYHATDTWMYRDGSWQIVAGQVLRYYEDPAVGKADPKKFPDYVGTYELSKGVTRTVTAAGAELSTKRGNHPADLLLPEAGDLFFRKGVEGRILFRRDDDGKVNALIDRRNNEDVVWKKIG